MPDDHTDDRRRADAAKVAEAYRSEPWWYDVFGFFILTFAYNSTLGQQLRLFGPNFGARHLEGARGGGTLLELVLRWRRWKRLPAVAVAGVGCADKMLLAGAGQIFAGKPGFEFLQAGVADMPLPDDAFDTANVAKALHSFPDVDAAARGIRRVPRSGDTTAASGLLYPHVG